jgi:hypothetical protein
VGTLGAFADGIRHFFGLAVAETDAAFTVTGDDESGEAETTATFDDFGATVDVNHFVGIFVGLEIGTGPIATIATSATTSTAVTTTGTATAATATAVTTAIIAGGSGSCARGCVSAGGGGSTTTAARGATVAATITATLTTAFAGRGGIFRGGRCGDRRLGGGFGSGALFLFVGHLLQR